MVLDPVGRPEIPEGDPLSREKHPAGLLAPNRQRERRVLPDATDAGHAEREPAPRERLALGADQGDDDRVAGARDDRDRDVPLQPSEPPPGHGRGPEGDRQGEEGHAAFLEAGGPRLIRERPDGRIGAEVPAAVVDDLVQDDRADPVHGEAGLGDHVEVGRERLARLRAGRRPGGRDLAVAGQADEVDPERAGVAGRHGRSLGGTQQDGRLARGGRPGDPGVVSDARCRPQAVERLPEWHRLVRVQGDPSRPRRVVRPTTTGKPVCAGGPRPPRRAACPRSRAGPGSRGGGAGARSGRSTARPGGGGRGRRRRVPGTGPARRGGPALRGPRRLPRERDSRGEERSPMRAAGSGRGPAEEGEEGQSCQAQCGGSRRFTAGGRPGIRTGPATEPGRGRDSGTRPVAPTTPSPGTYSYEKVRVPRPSPPLPVEPKRTAAPRASTTRS